MSKKKRVHDSKIRPQTNAITLEYVPSARQALFHASTADEVLYGGAAGGGKSKAIVMDAMLRCLAFPRTNAFMFRRTFREVQDTLVNEALASIPSALGYYRGTTHEFLFKNGSRIKFCQCKEERDRFTYQGAEIHWLYIDELTHFTYEMYQYFKTRLRASVELGIKPIVRCTSNPGGIGHAWVKSYFVDIAPYGEVYKSHIFSQEINKEKTVTRQYIPAKATDNPYITQDYIFELEQKPENLKQALLHGKWDAFEGQVFTEWRDNADGYLSRRWTHVVAPFKIPHLWRIYRSFDFGYAKPFSVGWWAIDPDGIIYRIHEWYGCTGTPNEGLRMEVSQIADGIKRFESAENLTHRVVGYADPSIWDGSRGQSIAQQLAEHGVYFSPGENSRIAGKMQLHQRLAFDHAGYPGLYVFSSCRDSIRTIPALCYDPKRVEDVDTQAEDHIYDDWRYMLMADGVRAPVTKAIGIRAMNPLER